MYGNLKGHLQAELAQIEENGLLKRERIITTPQGSQVSVNTGDDVVIMCANNYLGLSSHPEVIQASKNALDSHGYGMSSVRFIVELRIFIKNLSKRSLNFMVRKTRFCMQRHLTRTEVYLNLFLLLRMLLFLMN